MRHSSSVSGSSPHTRGARHFDPVEPGVERIIPAYAGSTGRRNPRKTKPKDHPRIRGEHATRRAVKFDFSGSSPHTRGAPARNRALQPVPGIIPAYAGSTSRRSRRRRRPRDHPRIRGEHAQGGIGKLKQGGSSPHTRGARKASLAGWVSSRIIPAYAGSTYCWEDPTDTDRDHPRIRGEHPFMVALLGIAWGSSPHTRGARFSLGCDGSDVGIIPAYAGSTPAGAGLGAAPGDHPRIRGEHRRASCAG